MSGWHLKAWRERAGLTLEALAERVGTSAGQLSDLEKGKRRFNRDWLERCALALGVGPADLLRDPDLAAAPGAPGVPVVGKVGASAEGDFADDYAMGAAHDFIEPLAAEGRIGLIVEGDSMAPRFRPGEKVVFGRKYEDPTPLVGREVMARLKDGRKLLKVLRRGSRPGLWTLYSINSAYDPIEDVELEWALPFEELRA